MPSRQEISDAAYALSRGLRVDGRVIRLDVENERQDLVKPILWVVTHKEFGGFDEVHLPEFEDIDATFRFEMRTANSGNNAQQIISLTEEQVKAYAKVGRADRDASVAPPAPQKIEITPQQIEDAIRALSRGFKIQGVHIDYPREENTSQTREDPILWDTEFQSKRGGRFYFQLEASRGG